MFLHQDMFFTRLAQQFTVAARLADKALATGAAQADDLLPRLYYNRYTRVQDLLLVPPAQCNDARVPDTGVQIAVDHCTIAQRTLLIDYIAQVSARHYQAGTLTQYQAGQVVTAMALLS